MMAEDHKYRTVDINGLRTLAKKVHKQKQVSSAKKYTKSNFATVFVVLNIELH